MSLSNSKKAIQARNGGGRLGHGAQLMVLCNHGYALPSTAEKVIICNNGSWEPPLQQCLPKDCALPQLSQAFAIRDGHILRPPETIASGQGVQIICFRGYALEVSINLTISSHSFHTLSEKGSTICVCLSLRIPHLVWETFLLTCRAPAS